MIKGKDFAIPQGSILGGLLHVINVVYIDDDSDSVSANDEASLKIKIQREAENSAQWISDNRLCVSGEKSKLMVVATNAMRKSKLSSAMSIVIDGKEVAETASEKLLGVRMNNELSWKSHLYGDEENIGLIQQLSQRVGVIRKLSTKMNKERLRIFAEGIFYSSLKYC